MGAFVKPSVAFRDSSAFTFAIASCIEVGVDTMNELEVNTLDLDTFDPKALGTGVVRFDKPEEEHIAVGIKDLVVAGSTVFDQDSLH